MTYECNTCGYEANNKEYSSSSGLYIINNKTRGACRGTCSSMGICTCG